MKLGNAYMAINVCQSLQAFTYACMLAYIFKQGKASYENELMMSAVRYGGEHQNNTVRVSHRLKFTIFKRNRR